MSAEATGGYPVPPDLFWQWSPAPGGLVPIERHGPMTITQSGAGGYVLWWYDRVMAQGSMTTVRGSLDKRLSAPSSYETPLDAVLQAASE